MKVSSYETKVMMLTTIINPDILVLHAVYVRDRMKEGNSLEKAKQMADYQFKTDIDLASTKAELILKLLER